MAGTKRMWAAVFAAFLAFFAALGFTSNATAAPAATAPRQKDAGQTTAPASESVAPVAQTPRLYDLSRPPTMKQRIRAEAHGSSPNARGLNPVTPLTRAGEVSEYHEAEAGREHKRPGNSEELPGLAA